MNAWMMLSWELIARHRRAFAAMMIYSVLICLVCPLMPQSWRTKDLMVLLLAGPCVVLPLLAASLAHGYDGRLEARASVYPPRLFTFPVSSSGLVGPPLLLGTLLTACWPLFAWRVMRPCGHDVPLFWPAALTAALLAWIQALSWTPFPLPWLRLIVMALLLPAVTVVGVMLGLGAEAEGFSTAALLGLLVVAYGAALTGVARARHGSGTTEPARVVNESVTSATVHRMAFASSTQAQGWYEWRRQGRLLLFTLSMVLFWALPMVLLNDWLLRSLERAETGSEIPELVGAVKTYGVGWLAASQLLLVPLMVSLSGADLGRLSSRRGMTSSTFLLTLPVTTTAFVRTKLWLGARLVTLAWLMAFTFGLLWAAISGRIYDMTDRLLEFSGGWPAALGVLAGGLTLGAAVTWLVLVGGLWGGLFGRRTLAWIPLASRLGQWIGTGVGIRWWIVYPDARPGLIACLAVLLMLKTVGVVWAARRLLARRLVKPAALAGWLLAWAVLAGVVGTLACRFTGAGPDLFAAVLFTLPLATPLAAPLALDAIRHQ